MASLGFTFYKWMRRLLVLMPFVFSRAGAQNKTACNAITADMRLMVRSVKINARWISKELQQQAEQVAGLGKIYDPINISAAQNLVEEACRKNEGQFEFQLLQGSTSVLVVRSDACIITDSAGKQEVAVSISPFYLRIDLFKLGNNILPVPRSSKPSFYTQVPAVIRATAPFASLYNDRRYGTSIGLSTATDLLHLPGRQEKKRNTKSMQTNLGFTGKKSLSNSFYHIGGTLELNHPLYTDSSIGWNVGVQFENGLSPIGNVSGKYIYWNLNAAVQGNSKSTLLSKYVIGTNFTFSKNSSINVQNSDPYNENRIGLFALADGRQGKSFTRLGCWFAAAMPGNNSSLHNYQQLVTRIGNSVFLGSGHNSVLVETIAGAGYTWGTAPGYNQFFAGNTQQRFLYDPVISLRNQTMQSGPLLRSIGEKEGGLATGNTSQAMDGGSFWHLNLNFSIPVKSWARPLIPDIVISETPRVTTLRTALKAQSETAKNFIYDDLVNNHDYPDNDETDKVAAAIVDKDIRPAINYLADRANVYAIKPLLLFDVCRINDRLLPGKTFTAAGLGLQLTVVIARLELGYMRTLSPADYKTSGNFFIHFVLQNFY